MTDCLLCGQKHSFHKCPLFGSKKTYLDTFAPKPFLKEEPVRSSLAPTLFEELYGPGAELILQDVPDHPESFTSDEINQAWQLLGGTKKIKGLDLDERELLDSITHRLAEGKYDKPRTKHTVERHPEADEGPPRDEDHESMETGRVEPSEL